MARSAWTTDPFFILKSTDAPFERILLQRLFWNQGVANVLVLADPTHVQIYSGLAKPVRDHRDQEAMGNALVETFVQADYVQRIQSLYHNLATGHYYEAHQNHFNPNQTVDSWLLDNLRALRDALIDGDDSLDARSLKLNFWRQNHRIWLQEVAWRKWPE